MKYETEVEPGKIRLITSGEFVRAYNHSAWLFYSCISKFKVIRKFSKVQQKDIYFLGFPASKLLELVNGRVCEKTDFGYDITLKPEEMPAEEGYEEWTKDVPVEMASRADANRGVEFLGAYVKPYRTYPSTRSLCRMRGRMKSLDWSERPSRIQARVNSMLGTLSHYDCWHMRKVLVWQGGVREFGEVSDDCLRFYPDELKLQRFQTRASGGTRK